MGSVAFCPPTFVHIAWLSVQQEAPDTFQVDQLIQYFNETWFNGQFAIEQWNFLIMQV